MSHQFNKLASGRAWQKICGGVDFGLTATIF
jgi:hypothetical protein